MDLLDAELELIDEAANELIENIPINTRLKGKSRLNGAGRKRAREANSPAAGEIAAAETDSPPISPVIEEYDALNDDVELDDEEGAYKQRYMEEVDDAIEHEEQDEDYVESGSDSENEEVRHRVRKQKKEAGEEDDAGDDDFLAKQGRKAPATSKELILEMRKENQKLRKSVPINMPKRAAENSNRVALSFLVGSIRSRRQNAKPPVATRPKEEVVLGDMAALCHDLSKPASQESPVDTDTEAPEPTENAGTTASSTELESNRASGALEDDQQSKERQNSLLEADEPVASTPSDNSDSLTAEVAKAPTTTAAAPSQISTLPGTADAKESAIFIAAVAFKGCRNGYAFK
jgi:hypothetical protein